VFLFYFSCCVSACMFFCFTWTANKDVYVNDSFRQAPIVSSKASVRAHRRILQRCTTALCEVCYYSLSTQDLRINCLTTCRPMSLIIMAAQQSSVLEINFCDFNTRCNRQYLPWNGRTNAQERNYVFFKTCLNLTNILFKCITIICVETCFSRTVLLNTLHVFLTTTLEVCYVSEYVQ